MQDLQQKKGQLTTQINKQGQVIKYEEDHRYDEYIQMLKSQGISFSDKLQCAFFKLKNGLKYPGLMTKQTVYPNEILVSIPIDKLLTSQTAQQQYLLKDVYLDNFYHTGPIWQDRILVTYLLFALDNKPKQLWAIMAKNFSKDIDILSFWSKQDLCKFRDKSVCNAAQLELSNFQTEWSKFLQIQKKYQILQTQSFTYNNYKWIYTHAVSRCFGAYLNSTYFVPYCQFFNHNCTDVSYECITDQQDTNSDKEQTQCNQNQDTGSISSISECSGDSEDYIEEGDFNYQQVPTYNINWCSKVSFNLKQKQTKKIEDKFMKIMIFLENQLLWKGINLLYIGQILQKANLIKNQYMAERKKFPFAFQELQSLLYHANLFKKHAKQFYKHHGANYKVQNQCQYQSTDHIPQNKKIYASKQPIKKYKTFRMITHSTFKPLKAYQQIYFEYGRLSNRTLLLRYGFSLQNNRYQHVWIRYPLKQCLSEYPDLFQKVQQKGLSIYYKLKLKPYVLNTEIITLLKLQKWKLYGSVKTGINSQADFDKIFGVTNLEQQQLHIESVIEIYEKQLLKYGKIQDLYSKQLSYHQYFINVYHNQKISILTKQIHLLKQSLKLIEAFKNKQNTFNNIFNQCFPQRQQKKMVYHYLKNLKTIFR